MKKGFAFVAALLLASCAQPKYTMIIAPKKTAEETVKATKHAERIFNVYHAQGIAYLSKEIAKPEIQEKLKETITDKLDSSSLGECLTTHGFGEYLTQRMLADVTAEKLQHKIVSNWVSQFPSGMLSKIDQTMNGQTFKKIFQRMREMPNGNIREKLQHMREENFITEAESNEFILATKDTEIHAFMMIAQQDAKKAADALLYPYVHNPASVVLEFMQTHPAANYQCSILQGGSL